MVNYIDKHPNPQRVPNVAKYAAIARQETTRSRMCDSFKVNPENGCWEWTRVLSDNGYGRFISRPYGLVFAHRLALHLADRPVPSDMTVDHLCFNRKCVNPDHLDVVPVAVNILRGMTAGGRNARKTHCLHGHEFTPANTYVGKSRTKIGTPTRSCKTCAKIRNARQRELAK